MNDVPRSTGKDIKNTDRRLSVFLSVRLSQISLRKYMYVVAFIVGAGITQTPQTTPDGAPRRSKR